jgi:uncharacterized Zn finger protein
LPSSRRGFANIIVTRANLKDLLTRLKLRRIAGAKPFEHGAEYFAAGRVSAISEEGGKLVAIVQGTEDYRVTLFADGNALACNCTCPMGAEGAFCKHGVAVGLAWLGGAADVPEFKENPAPTPASLDEIRTLLAREDKSQLLEIILKHAAASTRFREQLLEQLKTRRWQDREINRTAA